MTTSPTISRRLRPFRYFAPTTLDEVVSILGEYGEAAHLLAGGTDVIPMMKLNQISPQYVIGLKRTVGLDSIELHDDVLRIGARTTISSVLASEVIRENCPSLHQAARSFATPQHRNVATVGGNICRSSPGADMVPPLIAMGAELTLLGQNGRRRVPLDDFAVGPGRNILAQEVLTEIVVPALPGNDATAFAKLTRTATDVAKVNCAVRIATTGPTCDDIRIVLGAVAATPLRAKTAEASVRGREISDELLEQAAQQVAADLSPVSDARSTAAYRAQVSGVLVKRTIQQALKETKHR